MLKYFAGMLLLLATTSFSFAFTFTITGKTPLKKGVEIRWYAYEKIAEEKILPDSNGKFTIKGQLLHPGEIQLKAYYKNAVYPISFFLFTESQLQASFNPSAPVDFWQISGLCARCKAFDAANQLAYKTQNKINQANAEKTTEQYVIQAKKISGIGVDDYTTMLLDMQALSMLAGVVDTATTKMAYKIFEHKKFAPYTKINNRYVGFSLYKSLECQYTNNLAYDSAVTKQIRSSSMQISLFTATIKQLKKQTQNLPDAITAECMYNLLLDHKDPAFRDSLTIEQMKQLCSEFLQQYPKYPGRSKIELVQQFYTTPLLRNSAPELTLLDKKENEFKLSSFKQKYVVLNLISPYEQNYNNITTHLRDIQQQNSSNKKIQVLFVHAFSDQRYWLKQMRNDTSTLRWLIPIEADYLSRLQVTGTPVTYIISPKGKVLYKGHPLGITDELVKKFLTGRYD
jgi:hypothetical protein